MGIGMLVEVMSVHASIFGGPALSVASVHGAAQPTVGASNKQQRGLKQYEFYAWLMQICCELGGDLAS